MAISAVQSWVFSALAEVPTKVFTRSDCFRARKNNSICQRSLYTAAMVAARYVRFSPRDDLIAFVESSPAGDSIRFVDRNGKQRVISSGWADATGLAWNPLSGEIWFTAREAGGKSGGLLLHAVSLAGKHREVARIQIGRASCRERV